jgi:TPR repeat protein|tara:strand:- start:966 stop:2297 length:1332 start_codon:yes stop_codon:yes gene_type:complete
MKKCFMSFCALIGFVACSLSFAVDSKEYIDRAVTLIEEGEFSLARSYLGPALVDPYIAPDLRSKAFYLRGYSYFAQGLPVSSLRDFNRALEFSPNNPVVLFMVGRALYEGFGTRPDPALGVELFQRSADAGHEGASAYLGFALLQGNGITKDLPRAQSLLSAVAEKNGDRFAMVQMARSYRRELTDTPDPAMAEQWYQRAFAAGEANAYVALAYMYSKGEFELSEAVANERSFTLLREAMDAGAESAYARLAYAHLSGIGTVVNYDRAFELYMSGVELGQAQSFAGIAHMFEAGLGRSVDLLQAESWYLRGIQAGDEYAHSAFAYMLLGSGQDDRALKWLSRATRFGGAQSHNDLAWLLATSKITELRNAELSLQHALTAVGLEASAAYLDTLAAAYAESGLFEDALVAQEQAIAAALDEDEDVRQELEQHLLSYQKREPWRE